MRHGSLPDRLGGPWAFSWRASLVGSALISLLIIVRGSALSGQDPSPTGVASWLGVAAIAVAVKSLWQGIADKTILQHRHHTRLSLGRVLTFYAISGALFGTALVVAELLIAPAGSTATIRDSTIRALALAAATVCWYVITTILFDARERFWREREALLEQLVATQMSQIQEDQLLDELRESVRWELDEPVKEARLLTAAALLEEEASPSIVTDKLRELASGSVRSLSHDLMDEEQRNYSQGRLRDVWKTFALEIRFAIGSVMILIMMAFAIDTAVRNQSQVGLLPTILFASIGALCMWVANSVMDRLPRFRLVIYLITFIALLFLTLVYVSGRTFTAVSQGQTASFDMSLAEFGFLVLLSTIGLLGTSYASAVLSNRQQILDRLRIDTDSARAQEIANARRLATATRQLGSELHGALQTRLMVCAGAIDAALANGDAVALRESLKQAWEVLKMPLDSQAVTGSVFEMARHQENIWAGLLDFECDIDPKAATVSGKVAEGVCVVLEEGIANAYRHGQATEVQIAITSDGPHIVVQLKDNGSVTGDMNPGIGTQRMSAIGQVSLQPNINGGLILTVLIPLEETTNSVRP